MKTYFLYIYILLSFIYLRAQNSSTLMITNFSYQPINSSQHNFTYTTSFVFGSPSSCPQLINPTFIIENNILYVKGYYDIRGAWPANYCQSQNTISYNQQLASNITNIITSTNVIKYSSNPNGWEIEENVYTQNFVLNLSNDIQEIDKVIIYPNPTNNFITIQNNQRKTENIEYEIVDLTGRIVKKGKIKFNEDLSIENLTKGNYFIQIETENGEKTIEKLIKK
jgi:Secretion system C-terminal sorting domain